MADSAKRIHETKFVPNPVQRQFIESRARADLYSSRMGEGKSTAICWAILYHTRHNPGAKWVLSRDTWENLRATTMASFFEWFPPGIYGTWHAGNKTFTWADGVAKGQVEFIGLDSPEDAGKLQSRELAGFAIDEPAPAVGSAGVDEMIFDLALSRLRQPGMNWYAVKMATNNPDESHWTYRRFAEDPPEDFKLWQPSTPENIHNLPAGYYEGLRSAWSHRPDLIRRFIEGEFGFQQEGKAVTPQWSDKFHLAVGLGPIKGREIYCLWDFGHNPTCILTQISPMGTWMILDALVGDGIGVQELVEGSVKPLLQQRYGGRKAVLRHIGDPAGNQREQTSIHRTAVRYIIRELGGTWRSGPVKPEERIEPLRAVLAQMVDGRGRVQVDRYRAQAVWYALRGGWHYHVARTGLVSGQPLKNIHSHPGDALSYGAALLFPMGRLTKGKGAGMKAPEQAGYFRHGGGGPLGFEKPGVKLPADGSKL